MSRLTSRLPFNRPSVFDVPSTRPGPPLSPPETELEPVPQVQHDENYASELQPGAVEAPLPRFRRVAYSSTGLLNRDARSAQKQSRWLVMVMPPASLNREPPTLGHTLSSAPAGRFSNGILIPLFPTLYGQLTAIAREFNMPSTTGLCVYLHIQDNGIPFMTPRISDESWQILWGHYFASDERNVTLPPHGLPISGRIEFDIDLRRAKWYNSWMGHPVRESADSELSREPSMVHTHWRGDSRVSIVPTDVAADESPSPPDPTAIPPSRLASQRHVPRPLLLERREASSIRSFSRHPSRAASISHEVPSPEELPQDTSALSAEPTFVPNALSPVVQEQEEPQTAKKADLATIVRQWREVSVTGPASTALAAAGQPSLDPVNMPAGTDIELDLNDFAWSISSAGPPTGSVVSPHWPEPLPSVHILGRLQGSVCLTPSTCTSFGPVDYDWPESPVSFVSRQPSPDLGLRAIDFAPLTPSTATSWGPDDFPSPIDSQYHLEYRTPSIDLGVRGMGSRPITPSTATSWGPADSPLFMSDSHPYTRTPDAGERAFPDVESPPPQRQGLLWPYYNAWSTNPWGHVWPYQAHYSRHELIALAEPPSRSRSQILLPEYPDFAALYPSNPLMERAATNKSQPVELPSSTNYPIIQPYPPVYPHHLDEIYPTTTLSQTWGHARSCQTYGQNKRAVFGISYARHQNKVLLPEYPDFAALYPSNSSMEKALVEKPRPVELLPSPGYPVIEPYSTVYPYCLNEIYPTVQFRTSVSQESRKEFSGMILNATTELDLVELSLPTNYPHFNLYPAVYPRNLDEIYPTLPLVAKPEQATDTKCQPVLLSRPGYPFFSLYPSVYPFNLQELYPEFVKSITVRKRVLQPEYPDFAALYPVDHITELLGAIKCQPAYLPGRAGYPLLEIYETAYPYNLYEIYPAVFSTSVTSPNPFEGQNFNVQTRELSPEYPDFTSLYPTDPSVVRAGSNKSQPITLPRLEGYPLIMLYPSVYPFNLEDIYPTVDVPLKGTLSSSITFPLLPEYPDFAGLYPSDTLVERVGVNKVLPVYLPNAGYPCLTVYTPVYPFNLDLYGSYLLETTPLETTPLETTPLETTPLDKPLDNIASRAYISIQLPVYTGYPTFNLYPASQGYPTFNIYPPIKLPLVPQESEAPLIKLTPSYPVLQVYEPVYPYLVIYPLVQLVADDEIVRPRPPNGRRRAPTPGPGRPNSRLLSPSSPGGEENHIERRRSRSPTKPGNMPPLPGKVSLPSSSDIQHSQAYRPRTKPKRTHHDLHMLVFGDISQQDPKSSEEVVPRLPSRVTSHSVPSRLRSRSGTVTGRPPSMVRPVRESAESLLHTRATASVSSRVSAPTHANPSPAVDSSILESPSSGVVPPSRRSMVQSVYGLPVSPASPVDSRVLSRVRSMNTQRRPKVLEDSGTAAGAHGLDRSRSMSDTSRLETSKRSVVSERAKIFSVPERDAGTSNLQGHLAARPITKLDRSKLPFA